MADNWLEKRYEQTLGTARPKVKRVGPTLDELLARNRSVRGYNKQYIVSEQELRRIVGVCDKIASGRNQQVLRYLLVNRDSGAEKVLPTIRLGGALPELHLPFKGTEPEAFIICCAPKKDDPITNIDLGIAAQSMLLKTTEMGLNGIIIMAFDHNAIKESFSLSLEPLIIIAIGKSIEHIELVPISQNESHNYYRNNDTHYVPKVRVEELILNNA